MPWSPTQSFPHPLATINHQSCKPTVGNFVSYAIVDMMVWEGLGDLVNKFRKATLSLDPLDSITAPSLIHRLRIPCSYLWYDRFCHSAIFEQIETDYVLGLQQSYPNRKTGATISISAGLASSPRSPTSHHRPKSMSF